MISLSFNICNDCEKLIFTESTGVYSATNTGGYGSPNENATFFNGELSVYKKTDTINPISTHTIVPSANGETEIPIVEDGIYRFVYVARATNNSIQYTSSQYVYFYCDLKACLMGNVTKDINNEANIILLQMFSMFKWELEYCGNFESADLHRKRILDLCSAATKTCNC